MRIENHLFNIPRFTFYLLFSLLVWVCSLTAVVADVSNRWEFTTPADYEVSDPLLIRANPANGGRAELILQETLLDQSSLTQYVADVEFDGVKLGSEQVLELQTDSGGRYLAPGIYRSRVIDKGQGSGSWDALFTRTSNARLNNSPAGISATSDGLVALYKFDQNLNDSISGDQATIAGSSSYVTDTLVGSHAIRLTGGGYATLANSSLIQSSYEISMSFFMNLDFLANTRGLLISRGSPGIIGVLQASANNLRFLFVNDNDVVQYETIGSLSPDRWYFVVAVWNGQTGQTTVYIDGVESPGTVVLSRGNGALSGPFSTSAPFLLSSDPAVAGRVSVGNFDEVAIWDKALNEDDIVGIINNLRSVQFRLRSSPQGSPLPSGDFVGPDGTIDSYFLGVADQLSAAGNFNPIHQYLQYEARLFTDGTRSETPQIQYVKFVTRDGQVFADGTSGDFIQGTPEQNVTNAPYQAYTPYFGLSRNANGGFRSSGTYVSKPIDGGSDNAVWERLTWRLPQEIDNTEDDLIGLYHLDGNWVDVAANGGANNPSAQNNTAFSAASRLGFNAAVFSTAGGGSTVSNFFTAAQNALTLSFWIKPEMLSGGVMAVGGGHVAINNNQLVTVGYGANSPTIYVNANPQSAILNPGWNHVALVFPNAIDVSDLLVGEAGGSPFNGLLDEMAIYNRALTMGQIQVQYYNAYPLSSGAPAFRVRAAETVDGLSSEPWSVTFSDPENTSFSVQGRYFQYEIAFTGDGSGTPTAGNVAVEGNDGISNFVFRTASFPEAADGNFSSGSSTWYGDEIYVDNFAATDPANLQASDFAASDILAGLWHFDENPWDISTSLTDSSGRGRPGSPVNGAASSPNARVGFRSGSFDGVDDYVELSQITELAGTEFSVGLWFNSRDSEPGSVISTYSDTNPYFDILLNHDGTQPATGKVAFVINNQTDGLRTAVSPAANLNNGAWRHVVGVRSAGYIHLYVDGTRVASTDIGNYGSLAPGTPRIMRNGTGTNYLSGNVDEVVMFGSALTPKGVGTIYASGYSTKGINEITLAPVDAGGPTIWQTLRWTADGIYGTKLSPSSALRGLWHMDTGAAGDDSSGNNFDATLQGSPSADPGVFDGGLAFNGSGDYLQVPHAVLLQSAVFSVSMWVKPESLNTRTLVDKKSGANGYALQTDASGRLRFDISGFGITDSLPLLQDVWQHVAATFDGVTMRLYVNGDLRAIGTPGSVNPASFGDLYIGRSSGGGQFFRGAMDEVAYFSRRLLDAEILDQYRAFAGTLKFQVRSGASLPLSGEYYGPDGTSNTYFSTLQEDNLVGVVPLEQYLQVKTYIGTDDHRFSPTFYGLSVSASRYPATAPWIAVQAAAGLDFLGKLLTFDHTRTFESGTDVKYQLSGDTNTAQNSRWFYYDGSQWTEEDPGGPEVYSFQTSSKTDVENHIESFYEDAYNKTGGVFRFRAFLKSQGEQPVALSNVTVTASEGRLNIVFPDGEERGEKALVTDVPYDVQWSWSGVVSDNLELAYSLNGYAGPWTVIGTGLSKGVGGTNSLTWTTPRTPQGVPAFTNVVMRIRDLNDASIVDTSDQPFEIVQRFRIVVPNGGEIWYAGETNTVVWQSPHNVGNLAGLYYAADGSNFSYNIVGERITDVAPNVPGSASNTFAWATPRNLPELLTTNGRVRVQNAGGQFPDESDEPFRLHGIAITSPTEGQKVKRGSDEFFDIEWTSIGAGTNVQVDISLDGGTNYTTNIYSIVTSTDGQNSVSWNVTQAETDYAVIRIRSLSDNRVVGISETFTIAGINIVAPNGEEEWLSGTTNTIEWLAGGAGPSVSLFYTDLYEGTNTNWLPIETGVPNTLSYDWVVSDRVSDRARVRVQSDEDPNLFAISSGDFNIAGARVTYPDKQTDRLELGEIAILTHDAAPPRWPAVDLEVSYDRTNTWELLVAGWTLNAPYPFTPTFPSRQTKVRVRIPGATTPGGDPLPNVQDLSDEYFTVAGLIMEAPELGSTNTLGEQTEIRWVSAGAGTVADIYYSSDGTNNYQLVDQGAFNNQNYPGRNPYPWVVPKTLLPSENATVKVVSGSYEATTEEFILRGVRITQPVATNQLERDTQYQVRWQDAGMSADASGLLELTLDGGANWETLTNDYDLSFGLYEWDLDSNLLPTTNAAIRMTLNDSTQPIDIGFVAQSDTFTIKGIEITSPTNGAAVSLGSTQTISFVAAAAGTTASLLYSPDGGVTFEEEPIAENITIAGGENTFDWVVELDRTPSTNAVIRIEGSILNENSEPFTLSGIRVDRPIGFDIWAVGENNPIEWVATVPQPIFNLDLVYEDNTTFPVAQNVLGNSRTYQLANAALRGQPAISNVVLRVTDRNNTAVGFSEPFRLVSQPIIEIVAPRAGDYLPVGQEATISWVKGGSMNASDFTVWFSSDGFDTNSTPAEDILGGITFNPSNNTYNINWLVPDRLGVQQIMVTNSANPGLVDISGQFEIVGDFDIIYPNGDPIDEPIFANETKRVSWFTQGSVSNVNLYYKAGNGDWTLVNESPIDNNPRQGRYQTTYDWTAPVLSSDSMLLRVQDANYPQIFDGTQVGPYDDSDDPFALNFYSITWIVGYFHEGDQNDFRELDKLSVTDSSGFSLTGLASPFTTNYPFGTFETVWYRQFFNDEVEFRWQANENKTNTLVMTPSDTEPDAAVLADFVYSPSNEVLTIHTWIERGGRILSNPDSTKVIIYDTNGTKLETLTSSTVLADGFFRIQWNNVLDTLDRGETYLARVEVIYNRVVYSAAVTYTLSLAPEFEAVEEILIKLDAMETNLTSNVTNLTAQATNFFDRASASLDAIEESTTKIETDIGEVSQQVGDFTNTVIAPLQQLTNELIGVIGPSVTNMAEQVDTLADSDAAETARILSRPTTIEFGSTNTILYRTARSLDASVVRLIVEGTGVNQSMREVGTGLGIYSTDVIANWGIGSYVITCHDRNYTASDRMVVEVVTAGAGSIGELAEQVTTLETQITNVLSVVNSLADPNAGINATLDQLGSNIEQVEAALSAAISSSGGDSTATDAAQQALNAAISDLQATSGAVFGDMSAVAGRLEDVFGSASDAAAFALSAKNEASSAATAAREIQDLLTGDFSLEMAFEQLDIIRGAVDSASQTIAAIPGQIGADALQSQLQSVAAQITEMAELQGYQYEVMLSGQDGEGDDTDGADEEMIGTLNQNMSEVKVALDFMQRVLDEKLYEPVVQESWLGSE